ncbi:MAG: SpoIIE family protein phosphatase [Campylobacterota bacterium]|nr:SpoIIE family protein phosphatase [Campylobacterota bacterium]
MFCLMLIGGTLISFLIIENVRNNNHDTAKKNLEMLSISIFQSIRNAMNTGNIELITKAEDDARDIENVTTLKIFKDKNNSFEYIKDEEIQKSIFTKESYTIDTENDLEHTMRMIKPMIASAECIVCHTDNNTGDVIGIMELTFSLENFDKQVEATTFMIFIKFLIFGALMLALTFYLVKKATKPLELLNHGFQGLINNNQNTGNKLHFTNHDEIGDIIHLFNEYMDKLNEEMKNDIKNFSSKVMDAQNNIVITTNGTHINTSNKALLDFFNVKDLEEFEQRIGNCICEAFDNETSGNYLRKEIDGKNWLEYLLNNKDHQHKVAIDFGDKKHIFYVTADSFKFVDEVVNVVVFNDITEIETMHQEIDLMHTNIKDSINYASLIQQSLIPDRMLFEKYFEDSFTIWEPKDIVGGDIYLFDELRNEDECLLLTIDCTGHGVPGAFVTMLIKAIERQVISHIKNNDFIEVSPAWILNYFNKTIKILLKQDNKEAMSNAGFDGHVLYYNKALKKVKYSSARSQIFYIQNNEIKIIKGDKHSVGYKDSDALYEFTEYEIDVSQPTSLYILSDGYIDQLGGDKNISFGKKRLQRLLEEVQDMNMKQQQDIILNALRDYQGDNERQDDITFIALKV